MNNRKRTVIAATMVSGDYDLVRIVTMAGLGERKEGSNHPVLQSSGSLRNAAKAGTIWLHCVKQGKSSIWTERDELDALEGNEQPFRWIAEFSSSCKLLMEAGKCREADSRRN